MNSIVSTYPDFQALPRGIKRLLLTSETEFFNEARPALQTAPPGRSGPTRFPRSHPAGPGGVRLVKLGFQTFQPADGS